MALQARDREKTRAVPGVGSGEPSAAGWVLRALKEHPVRLSLAAVAAAILGFAVHVLYGQGWAKGYVDGAAAAGRLDGILQQPYPPAVIVVAAATAVLPALGKVLVFLLTQKHLPGRSGWQKGLSFGALLLLAGDGLLRTPVMNLIVGNPVDVVLVQVAEPWAMSFVTGIAIGTIAPMISKKAERRREHRVG